MRDADAEFTVANLQQLLRRAHAGDRDAVGELLEAYRPYLRVLAQRQLDRRLAGRLDASDLIQQTCLSVHRRIAEFEGQDGPDFIAWLRRVHENNIQNAIRDHLNTQKRGVSREVAPEPGTAGDRYEAVSQEPSPSQRLLAGESAASLARALEQLPDDQREAVRLRYLEGWPLARIAEQLGRSREAAAGLLKRGLQNLRGVL